MELLLVRHGQAEDFPQWGGDAGRALTEKGHEQAKKVGLFLKKNDLRPDLVLCSPLVRARETAENLCVAAEIDPPIVESWLACGMSPELAMTELAAYEKSCARVLVVGHEPDFSTLAAAILEASCGSVEMKKASLIHLRCRPPSIGGILCALVPVKMLDSL